MPDPARHTTMLLGRVQAQDAEALNELMQRLMPRIERWVRRRRGRRLQRYEETIDSAQDVALQLFRYLPKVEIEDSQSLEKLLMVMIRSSLANRSDYLTAQRRALAREQPLDTGASISLDPADPTAPSPSEVAIANEREAWMRFALALLSAEDQELIFRRFYDSQGYAAIGAELGIAADAARMRCNRAQSRLTSIVRRLRHGDAGTLAAELEAAAAAAADDS